MFIIRDMLTYRIHAVLKLAIVDSSPMCSVNLLLLLPFAVNANSAHSPSVSH